MVNDLVILFSSSALYLSFPQYKAIIPKLGNYKKVLLNVNEMDTGKIDNDYIAQNRAKDIFDNYINMKPIKQTKLVRFTRIQRYMAYKKNLRNYLHKINPKAIIVCSDLSTSARIMSGWCYRKKIPFIILQPSFIEGIPEKFSLKKKIKYFIYNKLLRLPIYRKQNSYGNESEKSYLFLWGQYFILNKNRKNLFILGNPAFDSLFVEFSPNRVKKNAILICTENLDFFGIEIFNRVNEIYLKAINSKPEITFFIKVHPREPIEKYEKIFPNIKYPNVNVVKNQGLYELFRLCDIQMSVVSFSSFEAAATGLPIIIIRPPMNIEFPDHFNNNIELRVENAEEIENAIDLAYSTEYWETFKEKRQKYYKRTLYSTDGQSANRVADLIKKLINDN